MILGKKVVGIIPVRGNSKGIPRKNSRLLAGKPMLSYAISNGLHSRYIDKLFVTTEDPNLQHLAEKFGANVIERDEKYSRDEVPLDEVIADAVFRIEKELCYTADIVVSLQATSPLIHVKSIDKAIEKCCSGNYDTVVSAVCDPHLQWGYDSEGKIVPLYKERLNRQYLPKTFKETGGFVVAKRSVLNAKTRFGKNVYLQEVSYEEAVDIDDRYDWWLAEKSLLRKKICFHVIGDRKKGLGHVYRALSLADRIMDHDVFFIVNEDNQLALKKISSQFYNLIVCPKGREIDAIFDNDPDIVINDILKSEPVFMKRLKSHGLPVINFEDLGKGAIYADVVINELFDDHPYMKQLQRHYSGSDYCCLRDEFFYTRPKMFSEQVKNIIILFGGTDPENLTFKTLKWLNEIDGQWGITVILGLGYSTEKERSVVRFAERSTKKIQIVKDTTLISQYMREADLAITAAGRTVFELTSMGVPMVVVASNTRESSHSILSNSFGLVSLGVWRSVKKATFQKTVCDIINSDILRAKMRNSLLGQNVHNGIDRVLGIIQEVINKA